MCHFNNKHLKITAECRRRCRVDINTRHAAEIAAGERNPKLKERSLLRENDVTLFVSYAFHFKIEGKQKPFFELDFESNSWMMHFRKLSTKQLVSPSGIKLLFYNSISVSLSLIFRTQAAWFHLLQ